MFFIRRSTLKIMSRAGSRKKQTGCQWVVLAPTTALKSGGPGNKETCLSNQKPMVAYVRASTPGPHSAG